MWFLPKFWLTTQGSQVTTAFNCKKNKKCSLTWSALTWAMVFNEPSQQFEWFGFPSVADDGGLTLQQFSSFGLQHLEFFLKNIEKMLLLFFVLASFRSSFLMFEHSFSSSETRSLKFSGACSCSPLPLLLGRPRFCEFSRLSETNNQLEIDVRSLSCSKKRTCTITRRGNLSFCAAWALASNDSFWQFMSLQNCSLSESMSQGCAWSYLKCVTLELYIKLK